MMAAPIYDEEGQACCPECGEPLYRSLADVHYCQLCEIAYP